MWSQTNSRLAVVKRAAKDLVTILDPNGYNRVAVGITPWYAATRLDAQSATKWANKRWAAYAGTDSPLPKVEERCFDGRRFDDRPTDGGIPKVPEPTATAADLLAPPGEDNPFAQATCLEHPTRKHLMLSPLMPTLFPLSTDRAAIEASLDELVTGGGPRHPLLARRAVGAAHARARMERRVGRYRHPPCRPLDPGVRGSQKGHRAPHRRRRYQLEWRLARRCLHCGEGSGHRNFRCRRDAPRPCHRCARARVARVFERG